MAYRNIKLVGKKETLVSQEAFNYYREHSKKRNKALTSERKDFAKLLNSIYRKVREGAIEYKGDVYAENFFYVIPQPYPKKRFMKVLQKGGENKGTLNVHTDRRVCTLLFVNILPGTKNKMCDMSGAVFKKMTEKMVETLTAGGAKYIFSLDTLNKIRYWIEKII